MILLRAILTIWPAMFLMELKRSRKRVCSTRSVRHGTSIWRSTKLTERRSRVREQELDKAGEPPLRFCRYDRAGGGMPPAAVETRLTAKAISLREPGFLSVCVGVLGPMFQGS